MLNTFGFKTMRICLIASGLCLTSAAAIAQTAEVGVVVAPQAHLALGAIQADNVELSRIAEYQAELIELAREDVEAARVARRRVEGCAQRAQVKSLCTVLNESFSDGAVSK